MAASDMALHLRRTVHVCIDYRPALREGTGVGTYVRGLLGGLVRGFPEETYTAFSASWRDRLALDDELRTVRAVDARFPVRLLDWLWHRQGRPPLERWVGALDIAHSPSPLLMPSVHGRQVITIHDCYFLRHPEETGGVVRRDYVPLVRAAAQAADAILVVSETTRDELGELLDVPAERVHVTYNGLSDAFHPVEEPRERVRQQFGIEAPYVLFVGRREPRKDMPTLLAGFGSLRQQHPELELVLVGPDGDGWQAAYDGLSAEVSAGVRVLPHQQGDRLAELYAGAEILALTSRWEGFGLTAIEAMACGTPVVASRAGALPEIAGNAAQWFDVSDADGFATAASRVLTDIDLRAALVAAGHARAERYTWDRTAALTHAVYRKIAA